MTTLAATLHDSKTMVGRNMRHTLRNPVTLFGALAFPIIMLLLFVYVIGGAVNVGTDYLAYIAPGILMMGLCQGAGSVAIGVAEDMEKGIINRLRTMAIARTSVLTGHVVTNVVRSVACAALILGVMLLMGLRPNATFTEWLAVAGLLALVCYAVTWLTVALGLAAKTVTGASFAAFPLTFLPFVSSAFAPPGTMPAGVRWFTDNQPFTSVIDTLRGLLTGTGIGASGWLALGWCAVLALAGYLWSRSAFRKARTS
ncbi:ABC transporter permease [Amycolatopsis suaedae]|uniref:Transport permease protein n=1 Tax=Amycolatopsis suaedae TaxID=2510978 RepID=A0A4Q7J311_9PSEU|nr:ABC transporter permease [Amycolatopsis suaedae]RZQ61339.1 ABC transporter permease [Amycolatopsis suaedae]